MVVMKSYSLGFLLVFFAALVYAEMLPLCSGSRALTSQDAVEGKRPVLRQEYKAVVTSTDKGESTIYERSHGAHHLRDAQEKEKAVTQLKAKGVTAGDSMLRPKGKRNGAEATMTKSISIALGHVMLAAFVLVLLF